MSESDPLRKYVEAGIALTQLTRARAEAIVKDLVRAGDVQREHAQDRVEELLDRSRKGTDGLVGLIRREMSEQLSAMGFATKQDLAEMEARLVERLGGAPSTAGASPASEGPAARPAAAPKSSASKAAKKAPAAKASPRSAPVRGSAKASPPPGTAARIAGAAKGSRRRPATPPDQA